MKNRKILFCKKFIVFGFAALTGILMQVCPVRAEEADFQVKVAGLQAKFPDGKYWNHVGMPADNSDGYTDKPCALHKEANVSHVYGTNGCTCNHFSDKGHLMATQCMGFANKLGHDVFGDTAWIRYDNPTAAQIAEIRPGDIVRLNGYHSVFVIARNGNILTVGEANYPNNCKIRWNGTYSLQNNSVTYFERAANYDAVFGTGIQDSTPPGASGQPGGAVSDADQSGGAEPAAAEAHFTGWKETEDGAHHQYYKDGVLQRGKWLTLSGKKYYLDASGYRVAGFCEIDQKTYYFNSKGVLQKKKWVSYHGADYYVDSKGCVLTKQWLYYKNVLVYVKKDGAVAKKEIVKIDGKSYYFSASGKRSKGFKNVNGQYYYCNKSGVIQKKKWIKKGSKSYYMQKDGIRAENKLIKIGKYKYYFNQKGVMQKKKNIIYGNKVYKADGNGRCRLMETLPAAEEAETPDKA